MSACEIDVNAFRGRFLLLSIFAYGAVISIGVADRCRSSTLYALQARAVGAQGIYSLVFVTMATSEAACSSTRSVRDKWVPFQCCVTRAYRVHTKDT